MSRTTSAGGGGLIGSSAKGFWVLRLLERGGGYSSECSESVCGIQGQRLSFRYVLCFVE